MDGVTRVVQYGLGPIGIESAKIVLSKSKTRSLKLVGAVDIDPAKVGKDVAEILGLTEKTGIIISSNAREVFSASHAQVALHTTSSFVDKVRLQLVDCIQSGVNVISSTEELAYPFERWTSISQELDELAKKHRVAVLGTGVNPGFIMDLLPLALTGVCTTVRKIHLERVVDASKRRLPLQKKVGAGMAATEFDERKKAKTIGHIGLRESCLFLANGVGFKLDRVEEILEPMIAEQEVVTPFLRVPRGNVSGIHHTVNGYVGMSEVLSLDLRVYVGASDPHDAVIIDGDPPVNLVIKPGIFGDTATVAALVNAIPLVLDSSPGLKTMKDLPVPRVFND